MKPVQMRPCLMHSAVVISVMTLLSRLLGFIRDMLIARLFGVDIATDAFFAAFKLPNLFRRLFAEGAFAHAFVPVLTDYKENRSSNDLKVFIARALGTLAIVMAPFTLGAMVAAPFIISLLAPGFADGSGQQALAAVLLRYALPFLFFITLTALLGALLNVHGKFALPALAPIWLNVAMIAAALGLNHHFDVPVMALAWGVSAGGLAQVLFLLPAVVRLRLLSCPRLGLNDAGVRKVAGLLLPSLFSVSVTQLNLLFDTLIASFLAAGSVSWLYYSDRLVEFPLGILGAAISTAILPRLSRAHIAGESEAFSAILDWGLRWALLIGLPASLGLSLLAEPILCTLFQYGHFDHSDVYQAGLSLRAYASGLLGFLLIKALAPAFAARLDVKSPFRYGVYAMMASLAFNVLAIPLAHAGLALATSLGAYCNALFLWMHLRRAQAFNPMRGWGVFLFRIVTATIAMAAVLASRMDTELWSGLTAGARGWRLIVEIGLGLACYIGVLIALGMRLPGVQTRAVHSLQSHHE